MRYTAYTYCLTIVNDGEIVTLGSRDKYYFTPARDSSSAELYLIRFNCGRLTGITHQDYKLKIFELASCGLNADVNLETDDIILGVASSEDGTKSGSGCLPYLYILRPIFQRNMGTVKNPVNRRGCGGE